VSGGADVTVVILHWGAAEVTARCLRSLREVAWPGRGAVVLVDNTGALDAGLAARAAPLPVRIVRPGRNLGFAEGCNLGISLAAERDSDFILLLNNDVVVEPGFLAPLVTAAIRRDDVALVSPHIVRLGRPGEGWYQGGSFSLWSGIPVQGHRRPALDRSGPPREVDYATGCAMLIRPAVVPRIGSFDGRLFAYCEDLDLSIRARRAGFRVLCVPASVVHHDVSDEPDRAALRIYYSTRNLLEVMRKHAAWYHWLGFVPSFLARWIGFFVVLALVRRQPSSLSALATGVVDGVRRRLGPSPWIDDNRSHPPAGAEPGPGPRSTCRS